MTELIHSKTRPLKILHIIRRFGESQWQQEPRLDIIKPENFIQCACMNLKKGQSFAPHKHIRKKRTFANLITQESWVVIKGAVEFTFYDLDDTIMGKRILFAGDLCATLAGGHTYRILENNTIVYEFKTGPYEGQEQDKVFINQDEDDYQPWPYSILDYHEELNKTIKNDI